MHLPRRAAYVAACLTLVAGAAAAAASSPSGGDVATKCYAALASGGTDTSGYRFCRSAQALDWIAAAACRTPTRSLPQPGAGRRCAAVDGRTVSEADIRAYERSWVHRALSMQRALSMNTPLVDVQLPHSHNSFNASAYVVPRNPTDPAYYPTLTNQDPNQVYSITDQLRMDIRAIEIDVHWVPSPYGTAATGGYWVSMCHGDTQSAGPAKVHVGCTIDRPLQSGLAELRAWIISHPHNFVLLYLENQLDDNVEAHDLAARLIKANLGSHIYRPQAGLPSGHCADMPLQLTPGEAIAAGRQVLLVGNCGPGSWNQWVFTRGPQWDESGKSSNYTAADCAHDEANAGGVFRRYYEESPWLEAMTGGTDLVTAATTARMVHCGVNIIGFDQLEPTDGRLAALVWSWAPGEPRADAGDCAYVGSDGRMHAGDCGVRRHVACRDADGTFHVTDHLATWQQADHRCRPEHPTGVFAVPTNGFRAGQLDRARPDGDATVWVAYRDVGGSWRATSG